MWLSNQAELKYPDEGPVATGGQWSGAAPEREVSSTVAGAADGSDLPEGREATARAVADRARLWYLPSTAPVRPNPQWSSHAGQQHEGKLDTVRGRLRTDFPTGRIEHGSERCVHREFQPWQSIKS